MEPWSGGAMDKCAFAPAASVSAAEMCFHKCVVSCLRSRAQEFIRVLHQVQFTCNADTSIWKEIAWRLFRNLSEETSRVSMRSIQVQLVTVCNSRLLAMRLSGQGWLGFAATQAEIALSHALPAEGERSSFEVVHRQVAVQRPLFAQ